MWISGIFYQEKAICKQYSKQAFWEDKQKAK